MKMRSSLGDGYMGTTVVGERGQVVIPKELRDELRLKAGDRLVMFKHEKGPVVIFPMEEMRSFMKKISSKIAKISRQPT